MTVKRYIKRLLGALIYSTRLHRLILADRAVVAVFHRIDDRFPGNEVTSSTREFRAYCAFFRRHFRVVSLGELLARLARGDSVGGHLVITFDDGYKDNVGVAAAELERRRLPACFFVVTEFIGSARVPWWDAQSAIPPEWMTWDDVRQLHKRGFEIGAHTMNHADLGKVDGDEAEREITGARERVRAELGTETPFFSYPYGRPEHMSDANRDRVRRAGYRCCLSAYGGTVRAPADPFQLKREPVTPWYTSPYEYGYEVLWRGPDFRPISPSAA